MRIVILLMTLVISACSSVEKPKGELCSHWREQDKALCNDLKNGDNMPDVPMKDTDRWIMFSPDTWKNIMDYIDALKRKVGQQRIMSSDGMYITEEQINKFQFELQEIYNKNQSRYPQVHP